MKIRTREAGKARILDLGGNLVLGDPVRDLSDAVKRLLAEGQRHIVLNLREVDWIDSSGLGELVACQKRARQEGGEIKLVGVREKVREIIVLVRLQVTFGIYDDEVTAVGSF